MESGLNIPRKKYSTSPLPPPPPPPFFFFFFFAHGWLPYTQCLEEWKLAKRFAVMTTFSFMSQFLVGYAVKPGEDPELLRVYRYVISTLGSVIKEGLQEREDSEIRAL